MATQVRERRDAVPVDKFLPEYVKAYKAGLTNEEFAEKIGMAPASVTSRASQLRKQLKEKKNIDLPYLKSKRGQGGSGGFDAAADLISDLLAEDEDESGSDEGSEE